MNLIMMLCVFLAGVGAEFPPELVAFTPFQHNPVFRGAGHGHWDEAIRERGWILREDGLYHLWYTGYQFPESNAKSLGYATSVDGIHWERYPGNPIFSDKWTEDMMVVKVDSTYYMFAEGLNDEAHMLTSTDRIHWVEQGTLHITKKNGDPIGPGPFGTPTAFYENGTWYLFYERDDVAVWLATSKDLDIWTNVQDEPVLEPGPGNYDQAMIALNQIVKYRGSYYAYYHGLIPDSRPKHWTTNIAVSQDLIHWTKYAHNPILDGNRSSGVLVDDGDHFRLYTMHPVVRLYLHHASLAGRRPAAISLPR